MKDVGGRIADAFPNFALAAVVRVSVSSGLIEPGDWRERAFERGDNFADADFGGRSDEFVAPEGPRTERMKPALRSDVRSWSRY